MRRRERRSDSIRNAILDFIRFDAVGAARCIGIANRRLATACRLGGSAVVACRQFAAIAARVADRGRRDVMAAFASKRCGIASAGAAVVKYPCAGNAFLQGIAFAEFVSVRTRRRETRRTSISRAVTERFG